MPGARAGSSRPAMIAVLFLLFILVAAILVIALTIGGTGGRLRAELARIKAAGEPLAAADLVGPNIPNSQNAAVVYSRVFKIVSKSVPKADQEILSRLLQPNADEKTWSDARRIVARCNQVPALLRKAALMPRCRYPVDWEEGMQVQFPHHSKLRDLSRLLSARVLVTARDGDADGAAELLSLNVNAAESLKEEPSLIGQLVRMAMMEIGSRGLSLLLANSHLGEKQARRLFDSLGKVDLRRGMVVAFQGERVMALSVFDVAREGGLVAVGRPNTARSTRRTTNLPYRLWRDADELCYLNLMRTHLKRLRLSYREVKAEHPDADRGPEIPKYAIFTAILCPVYGAGVRARDIAQAHTACGRACLALRAFRCRSGAYPKTLKEIDWKLDKDPFSGNDLTYRRRGIGFTLYSIGPNLEDNGGREPKAKDSGYSTGDIVWKLAR